MPPIRISTPTLSARGTNVFFWFGDLTNADRDVDQEFVVVEFNALVENIAGNQAYNNVTGALARPVTLTNRFRTRIGAGAGTTRHLFGLSQRRCGRAADRQSGQGRDDDARRCRRHGRLHIDGDQQQRRAYRRRRLRGAPDRHAQRQPGAAERVRHRAGFDDHRQLEHPWESGGRVARPPEPGGERGDDRDGAGDRHGRVRTADPQFVHRHLHQPAGERDAPRPGEYHRLDHAGRLGRRQRGAQRHQRRGQRLHRHRHGECEPERAGRSSSRHPFPRSRRSAARRTTMCWSRCPKAPSPTCACATRFPAGLGYVSHSVITTAAGERGAAGDRLQRHADDHACLPGLRRRSLRRDARVPVRQCADEWLGPGQWHLGQPVPGARARPGAQRRRKPERHAAHQYGQPGLRQPADR